jgi:hypothetical protein
MLNVKSIIAFSKKFNEGVNNTRHELYLSSNRMYTNKQYF